MCTCVCMHTAGLFDDLFFFRIFSRRSADYEQHADRGREQSEPKGLVDRVLHGGLKLGFSHIGFFSFFPFPFSPVTQPSPSPLSPSLSHILARFFLYFQMPVACVRIHKRKGKTSSDIIRRRRR